MTSQPWTRMSLTSYTASCEGETPSVGYVTQRLSVQGAGLAHLNSAKVLRRKHIAPQTSLKDTKSIIQNKLSM